MAFYSWLCNIDMGKKTAATPDVRLGGEPLNSDHLPSPGKGRSPTEMLNAMAVILRIQQQPRGCDQLNHHQCSLAKRATIPYPRDRPSES